MSEKETGDALIAGPEGTRLSTWYSDLQEKNGGQPVDIKFSVKRDTGASTEDACRQINHMLKNAKSITDERLAEFFDIK